MATGQQGCVACASGGALALAAFQRDRFDLVLMDIQMPVLDGIEATREIRAREFGHANRIPIIAVTANAMDADRQMCIDAGMDDFLGKPVKLGDLASVLERYGQAALTPR